MQCFLVTSEGEPVDTTFEVSHKMSDDLSRTTETTQTRIGGGFRIGRKDFSLCGRFPLECFFAERVLVNVASGSPCKDWEMQFRANLAKLLRLCVLGTHNLSAGGLNPSGPTKSHFPASVQVRT
jgi:hypothetical protein